MYESFVVLKGKKVCEHETNKYFGRLSDIIVNKDSNKIIGIISKNEALLYRHRFFPVKDICGGDEVNVFVKGFGERFVKVIPVWGDFICCGNDIYKRKAVYSDGSDAGKIQDINFDFEAGIITEFEVGFSLAQDLLVGRKLCRTQDKIDFYRGNIVINSQGNTEKIMR